MRVYFISVDVDAYTPTAAILKMLEDKDESRYLPRVEMYFDDIEARYEFQGEWLAIREFNKRNSDMKISPEGLCTEAWINEKIESTQLSAHNKMMLKNQFERRKQLHRFKHPDYLKNIYSNQASFPLLSNVI